MPGFIARAAIASSVLGWYLVVHWWIVNTIHSPYSSLDGYLLWFVSIPVTVLTLVTFAGVFRALVWVVTGK
jgi:hypothetical protein